MASITEEIQNNKLAIGAAIAAVPIIYQGVKIWIWTQNMKPVWKSLSVDIPGPKKNRLFGNLHQVCMFIS